MSGPLDAEIARQRSAASDTTSAHRRSVGRYQLDELLRAAVVVEVEEGQLDGAAVQFDTTFSMLMGDGRYAVVSGPVCLVGTFDALRPVTWAVEIERLYGDQLVEISDERSRELEAAAEQLVLT
jgi:hypothetical protein